MVVGMEYYVGQFLKNNWELTIQEDFVNSHSVLTLEDTHVGRLEPPWLKHYDNKQVYVHANKIQRDF